MQYWQHRSSLIAAMLATVAAVLAAGCGGEPEGQEVAAPGLVRAYESGPLNLAVRTSAETISTAETLTLTLAATVEDGHSVTFPAYPETDPADADTGADGEAAGPAAFTLAGYEDTPPELLEDGRVIRSRNYTLEPFLDGAYEIPPLEVQYWKEVEGEDQKTSFTTEPLAITVTSVIADGTDPALKEIAGPRSVQDPFPWLRYTLIALLLAAIAAAVWWYKFRYTPPPPPPAPAIPPHRRALDALESIRRSKLVEQGRYKEYYIRVSGVLRRYMEEQFQVRAPERTTEEFLEDLQHSAALGLQEQLLLREFLRHCDLVKFARAEPTPEQIGETMETCERFIIDSEASARDARTAATAPEGA